MAEDGREQRRQTIKAAARAVAGGSVWLRPVKQTTVHTILLEQAEQRVRELERERDEWRAAFNQLARAVRQHGATDGPDMKVCDIELYQALGQIEANSPALPDPKEERG